MPFEQDTKPSEPSQPDDSKGLVVEVYGPDTESGRREFRYFGVEMGKKKKGGSK